jgi:hypothetical protein
MMMNRGMGVCASQKGGTKRTADRELRRPTSFWVSCWGKAFQHLQPARDRQQNWPLEAFLYGPFSNEIGCVCMYTFLSTYTCDNFLYIDQSIYIYVYVYTSDSLYINIYILYIYYIYILYCIWSISTCIQRQRNSTSNAVSTSWARQFPSSQNSTENGL